VEISRLSKARNDQHVEAMDPERTLERPFFYEKILHLLWEVQVSDVFPLESHP
jgi:hypothetical protein